MTVFTEQYDKYLREFNCVLDDFCANLDVKPEVLSKSLKYSLEIGGKRIRPVIMYATAELLGVDREKIEQFALATELIHTYSLIHDDLPEMDNDDFRRGKPSNHKVFGEGNAILAGDGLLNTAYAILLRQCRRGSEYIGAAEFICECAGIHGMIAGQSADLLHENDMNCDDKILEFIYVNKTAKMITAPLVVPSILCGGKYYSELNLLGKKLGCLFQLTDDILDVEGQFEDLGKSTGKDSEEGKYSAVRLFGLSGAKVQADLLADQCLKIIEALDGDTQFLKSLVGFVLSRKG